MSRAVSFKLPIARLSSSFGYNSQRSTTRVTALPSPN